MARLAGLHPTKHELMHQLGRVGIEDRADSKVRTFSQGMKQRLGIACALDQFEVSLQPGSPAALLGSRVGADELSRWSFQDLFPEAGYAAALTVEIGFSRLVLWDLI